MNRLTPHFKFAVGSKVAYSIQFLRFIGMSHSGMAHARGVVTAFIVLGQETTLAQIDWDQDMPQRVNVLNLAPVGPNRGFANVD